MCGFDTRWDIDFGDVDVSPTVTRTNGGGFGFWRHMKREPYRGFGSLFTSRCLGPTLIPYQAILSGPHLPTIQFYVPFTSTNSSYTLNYKITLIFLYVLLIIPDKTSPQLSELHLHCHQSQLEFVLTLVLRRGKLTFRIQNARNTDRKNIQRVVVLVNLFVNQPSDV